MGSFNASKKTEHGGRPPGKIEASLNEELRSVEWGEYKLGDLFEIDNTLSFNTDKLIDGNEYDYVTRTSLNQGVLQSTGFVNKDNLNEAGTWSLGLLQMDFFYRQKPWYAGQFVRKITPKLKLTPSAVLFFSALLNKQKKKLLSVLVRYVDETFKESTINLPLDENGKINFPFMEKFITELEAYLSVTGLKNYELTEEEQAVLSEFERIPFENFAYKKIFNNIKQGRRLRKEDQIAGNTPFVMSGTTNTGVVGYIANPVATFPKNSITIDIFGNSFYRNYDFGAGDDTGVYWNTKTNYSKEAMLFMTSAMEKSIAGKYSFGKKLRSSQSLDFKMKLPVANVSVDFQMMQTIISAIQKLVIKDVVLYTDRKINATKALVK